jgi:3-hydroxyacyl-CoA dehydrogenase
MGSTTWDSGGRIPCTSPPPLLLRMVDAGLLGKKTGRGYHDYTH